ELWSLGADRPSRVDVRVIAATNSDLQQAISGGGFRQDLFYRLAAIRLEMPPLRERMEDVPLLVNHPLNAVAQKLGRPVPAVSSAAMARPMAHPWPGNVRELVWTLNVALLLSEGGEIESHHIQLRDVDIPSENVSADLLPYRRARAVFQRDYL